MNVYGGSSGLHAPQHPTEWRDRVPPWSRSGARETSDLVGRPARAQSAMAVGPASWFRRNVQVRVARAARRERDHAQDAGGRPDHGRHRWCSSPKPRVPLHRSKQRFTRRPHLVSASASTPKAERADAPCAEMGEVPASMAAGEQRQTSGKEPFLRTGSGAQLNSRGSRVPRGEYYDSLWSVTRCLIVASPSCPERTPSSNPTADNAGAPMTRDNRRDHMKTLTVARRSANHEPVGRAVKLSYPVPADLSRSEEERPRRWRLGAGKAGSLRTGRNASREHGAVPAQ